MARPVLFVASRENDGLFFRMITDNIQCTPKVLSLTIGVH